MAVAGLNHYLAVKIGSASALGWVLLVYLISNPSEETPGTRKSLDISETYLVTCQFHKQNFT
jgi:hypothetical protein